MICRNGVITEKEFFVEFAESFLRVLSRMQALAASDQDLSAASMKKLGSLVTVDEEGASEDNETKDTIHSAWAALSCLRLHYSSSDLAIIAECGLLPLLRLIVDDNFSAMSLKETPRESQTAVREMQASGGLASLDLAVMQAMRYDASSVLSLVKSRAIKLVGHLVTVLFNVAKRDGENKEYRDDAFFQVCRKELQDIISAAAAAALPVNTLAASVGGAAPAAAPALEQPWASDILPLMNAGNITLLRASHQDIPSIESLLQHGTALQVPHFDLSSAAWTIGMKVRQRCSLARHINHHLIPLPPSHYLQVFYPRDDQLASFSATTREDAAGKAAPSSFLIEPQLQVLLLQLLWLYNRHFTVQRPAWAGQAKLASHVGE